MDSISLVLSIATILFGFLTFSLSSTSSWAPSSVNESLARLSRFRENEIWSRRVPLQTLEMFECRRFYLNLSIFELREKLKLPETAGSESEYGGTAKDIITSYSIER